MARDLAAERESVTYLNVQTADMLYWTLHPTEAAKLDALVECKTVMNDFAKEIINIRNILAHGQKSWDDSGNVTILGHNRQTPRIEFNRTWVMKMRSTLVKYRGVLNRLVDEELLNEIKIEW